MIRREKVPVYPARVSSVPKEGQRANIRFQNRARISVDARLPIEKVILFFQGHDRRTPHNHRLGMATVSLGVLYSTTFFIHVPLTIHVRSKARTLTSDSRISVLSPVKKSIARDKDWVRGGRRMTYDVFKTVRKRRIEHLIV